MANGPPIQPFRTEVFHQFRIFPLLKNCDRSRYQDAERVFAQHSAPRDLRKVAVLRNGDRFVVSIRTTSATSKVKRVTSPISRAHVSAVIGPTPGTVLSRLSLSFRSGSRPPEAGIGASIGVDLLSTTEIQLPLDHDPPAIRQRYISISTATGWRLDYGRGTSSRTTSERSCVRSRTTSRPSGEMSKS